MKERRRLQNAPTAMTSHHDGSVTSAIAVFVTPRRMLRIHCCVMSVIMPTTFIA